MSYASRRMIKSPLSASSVFCKSHKTAYPSSSSLLFSSSVLFTGDIAGGGAQMDDTSRLGSDLAKRVHVGHDVVAALLLLGSSDLVVDVGQVGAHLLNSLVGNVGQTQALLGDGEVEPELAPREVALVLREVVGHLLGGITRSQRRLVLVVRHSLLVDSWKVGKKLKINQDLSASAKKSHPMGLHQSHQFNFHTPE